MQVLVVSGSRSFEGITKNGIVEVPFDREKKYAGLNALYEVIHEWRDKKPYEPHVLVSGEAKGPDEWSLFFLESRVIHAKMVGKPCLLTHMQIRCDGRTITRPDQSVSSWSSIPVHPLERNKEITRVAAKFKSDGHDVQFICLVDTRSKSGGTITQFRQLKEAGIPGLLKHV